jgi:hypothetical protein
MAINFLNNVNLNKNQLEQARIENLGTDPGSGVSGQIYYNTAANVLKIYNSTQWVEVGGGVTSFTATGSMFINLTPDTTQSGAATLTASLSALGTPDDTTYLRGDNTWSAISGISGTTYDLGSIQVLGNVAITLIGSDATTDTVTLVAGTNITLTDSGTNSITIDAANPDQTVTLTGDVTGTGTTSIATTISAGAVDFAMLNPTDVITAAEGIGNNNNDVTIPTSAAVKAYADSLIVGGLIYQGGYNADLNIPDLTTSPNSILKGWTYTVTDDGTFFGEQLRVGDVLIAEISSPVALADWTTVQNNIDLASLTQIGIGNVVASTADPLDGLSVTYLDGTATAGLDIAGLTTQSPANNSLAFIPFYDQFAGKNLKIGLGFLAGELNEFTSKAFTIAGTATITYPFTLTAATQNDVIIQLVDTVTNETVYADVDRISTTQATITFASTPPNPIRVLVQKIG